ncbi:MFS transporter [Paramaledivibacter caminithermalis]|jgi:MFS family permease|uniref:Major Facilitator Superfamily protein n=1 Tax=Paramaledivibacter caminithermalis (strain DSM 15212 / CIP 107654 / DViRD3) TaxID=1121301 RepID=A0A1M6RBQ6_PARC5|nr:MFS transporter [Paramaledivibacter caminithermalis]SHK29925.1 Major Facilitator Superfamily protein [Paramaledivibacter caminithermalis DSM 15212]
MNKVIQDHSKLIFLSALLGFQSFMSPILVIFYLKYVGVSFSQFVFLDSILFLLVAIFEVPSGYLADRFGRKRTLLISYAFTILSMIVLILFPSYIGALTSIIISGVFIPLGSGNARAIYFESFKELNEEKKLQKIYSKSNSISFVILTIIATISGFIAKINLVLPVIIDVILLVINFIVTFFLLHDDKIYLSNQETSTVKSKIGKFICNNNSTKGLINVTPIFLISALFFVALRVSYTTYQPLFEDFNIDIRYFGVIFALFNIICALSSYMAPRFLKFTSTELVALLVLATFITISFIGIFTSNSIFLILLFISLQQIVRGLHSPFFSIQKNYYIPINTKKRVTYLSYSNLLSTLLVSLYLYMFSCMNSRLSLKVSILYFGILISLTSVLIIIVHHILKRKGRIKCYQSQQ